MAKRIIKKAEDAPEYLDVGIADGSLRLSLDEVSKLLRLKSHESWPVLRTLLAAISDAATVTLRNRTCALEDIRYAQGGAAAACDLADLIDKDIPEWYTEAVARRSDEDHDDTP